MSTDKKQLAMRALLMVTMDRAPVKPSLQLRLFLATVAVGMVETREWPIIYYFHIMPIFVICPFYLLASLNERENPKAWSISIFLPNSLLVLIISPA